MNQVHATVAVSAVGQVVWVAIVAWVVVAVALGAWSSYTELRAKQRARVRREEVARNARTPGTPEWVAAQARVSERAQREREQLDRELEARAEGRSIEDWKSAERAAAWAMREQLRL